MGGQNIKIYMSTKSNKGLKMYKYTLQNYKLTLKYMC